MSARAGMRSPSELVAVDYTQLRPVRLSLQDVRLPLARQVLEAVASSSVSRNSRRWWSLSPESGG